MSLRQWDEMGDAGLKCNLFVLPAICSRENCSTLSLLLVFPSIRIETVPPDFYPQFQRRERVLLAAGTGTREFEFQL
jgi:hypothetical protein